MINEVRSPRINELFAIHAADHLAISTPPGTSDECTHPDVLDMHQEYGTDWNGYRYWMALTPLPVVNPNDNENPCIYRVCKHLEYGVERHEPGHIIRVTACEVIPYEHHRYAAGKAD